MRRLGWRREYPGCACVLTEMIWVLNRWIGSWNGWRRSFWWILRFWCIFIIFQQLRWRRREISCSTQIIMIKAAANVTRLGRGVMVVPVSWSCQTVLRMRYWMRCWVGARMWSCVICYKMWYCWVFDGWCWTGFSGSLACCEASTWKVVLEKCCWMVMNGENDLKLLVFTWNYPEMTRNDLKRPKMTKNDLKWPKKQLVHSKSEI